MEKYPVKREGEILGATHVNDLSEAAEAVDFFLPRSGSNLSGRKGQVSARRRWLQDYFEVIIDNGDGELQTNDDGLVVPRYEIRPRYFDPVGKAWSTDNNTGTDFLDASEFGDEIAAGDIVCAYWNTQRGTYVLSASGGGGCDSESAIWDISIFGKPTSGTLELRNIVVNNVLVSSITFNYNDTADIAKAKLAAGHSQISPSDLLVTGGPWPNAGIRFAFTGTLTNREILIPQSSWGNLFGGAGVGIMCAQAKKGHE